MTAALVEGPALPLPFSAIAISGMRGQAARAQQVSVVKNGFRRQGFSVLEGAGMTIQRRAIRTDNFSVGAHVQEDMGMIERRAGACALKFMRANLYYGNAHVIVKFRSAGVRHVSACLKICAVPGVSCVDGTAFGYSRYSGDSINWGVRPSP